jgi:hypothetical protein
VHVMSSNNNSQAPPSPSSSITSVQAPWRQSQKGSIYCRWGSLPDDIKSQLKQEDRYEITVGEDYYTVKRNEDGGFIVFRNTKAEHETRRQQQQQQQYYGKRPIYRIVQVQILPIEEANRLLAMTKGFELIGTDPIKIVDGQFFAVVGKKEKVQGVP